MAAYTYSYMIQNKHDKSRWREIVIGQKFWCLLLSNPCFYVFIFFFDWLSSALNSINSKMFPVTYQVD